IFKASRVIGPPLAGLVCAAVGPGWCFAVNAVSFLAILYSLWILRLAPAPTGIVRTHLLDDLREGIAYVRGHHVVRTLLILVALVVARLRATRPGRLIFGFGYAASTALVALAFSRQLLLSMVLTAAVAGCVMAVLATCNATIQSYAADSLRGRVMSIYTLALIG